MKAKLEILCWCSAVEQAGEWFDDGEPTGWEGPGAGAKASWWVPGMFLTPKGARSTVFIGYY